MPKPTMHVLRRIVAGLGVIALTIVTLPSIAFAHDPIFMTDDQTTPDTGPFMPDGTISWALYGQVLGEGDTRGFEFDLRNGDELFVGLLIPNLDPEVGLTDEELPVLNIERPDGTVLEISVTGRVEFDEPFTNTSYVNLAEVREPAMAGRYRATIVGNAPSRFSVAVGETELFFTEASRAGDRPESFPEIGPPLTAWYTTPPGGEPTGELAAGDAEVDLDLLEDAMESGEGSIAEGVDEAAVMGDAEADDEAEASIDATAGSTDDDAVVDSDSDTTASAADVGSDDGGGATWVAPVVIGVLAVVGGGLVLGRRKAA